MLFAVALALAGTALVPGGEAQAQGTDLASTRDRRNNADAAVKGAQARVDELFTARRALEAEMARLSDEQRVIAERLEAARSEAQQFVVAAYISGSGADVEQAIVQNESTTDVAYKTFFVKDRAERVRSAVDQQRTAFTEVDQRLADFAVRKGDNATALDQANADLERALGSLREADAAFRRAEAESRPPPSPLAPPSGGGGGGGGSGNASSAGWAALRKCESGGNYRAVNSAGYYGAYQFDQRTWNGTGGTGRPDQNSPAEQDYRAQILFNQRGAQPWPVCGKSLINDPNARREAVPP